MSCCPASPRSIMPKNLMLLLLSLKGRKPEAQCQHLQPRALEAAKQEPRQPRLARAGAQVLRADLGWAVVWALQISPEEPCGQTPPRFDPEK